MQNLSNGEVVTVQGGKKKNAKTSFPIRMEDLSLSPRPDL